MTQVIADWRVTEGGREGEGEGERKVRKRESQTKSMSTVINKYYAHIDKCVFLFVHSPSRK